MRSHFYKWYPCPALQWTAMNFTTQHYHTVYYNTMHCSTLHCTTVHCSIVLCTPPHCTTVQCITLQCSAPSSLPKIHPGGASSPDRERLTTGVHLRLVGAQLQHLKPRHLRNICYFFIWFKFGKCYVKTGKVRKKRTNISCIVKCFFTGLL